MAQKFSVPSANNCRLLEDNQKKLSASGTRRSPRFISPVPQSKEVNESMNDDSTPSNMIMNQCSGSKGKVRQHILLPMVLTPGSEGKHKGQMGISNQPDLETSKQTN